jgi:hypothetical protein
VINKLNIMNNSVNYTLICNMKINIDLKKKSNMYSWYHTHLLYYSVKYFEKKPHSHT